MNNLSKQLQQLADKVVYAETTLSEYYTIGCIKVRFSDHMATDMDCDLAVFSNNIGKQNVYIIIPMVGTFKEVQWFTNVKDVIEFITHFESVARLLIKSPTHNSNQTERREANLVTKSLEKINKVNYGLWKQKLTPLYNAKKGELVALVDEIFQLSPVESTFKDMMTCTGFTHDNKVAYLTEYIENLKNQK